MATVKEVSGPSLQLLQVTPDVLCECFLQTSFLHTSQHCFNNHIPPHFLHCYALHRQYWISQWGLTLSSISDIGLSDVKSSSISPSLTLTYPISLLLSVSANISPKALARV